LRPIARSALLVLGLSGALAGGLLAGCTVGPDYERPDVELPEAWREPGATQETASLADTPWWELFQDPELQSLIEIALEENRDLRIAVERIEEARALYGFTKADLFPKVDAVGQAGKVGFSRNGTLPPPPGEDRDSSIYSVGASVFWELDFFGRIRRATEAQQAILFATEEARRAVVLTLVSEVARVYVELRDLDARLQISRDTLQSRIQYVALARDRFEGGVTSELDWRQAEAEQHRTASFVHAFEQLVEQKENELSVLVGRNPGPLARGLAVSDMPLPPAIPAGLPSDLVARRPDLRQAEELLVATNARVGEATASLYPNITLTGSYGWESTELDNLLGGRSITWSALGNIAQPIFNAGQNRSAIEAAESRWRQAVQAWQQAILVALREVNDALVGYRKAGDRRIDEGSRVQAEQQVLELSELRYRGGVSDYLEVLDAQRSLFSAQLDEATAVRDQLVSFIQLYKALGGGWPQAPEAGPEAAAAPQAEGETTPAGS